MIACPRPRHEQYAPFLQQILIARDLIGFVVGMPAAARASLACRTR
jgi:hypothetical protein